MNNDDNLSRNELLYQLRLQRIENLRLKDQLQGSGRDFSVKRQLKYLESTALIDKCIRQHTDLSSMMNSLMAVVREIFNCDQAWLLYPCDPGAPFWHVPYRSVLDAYPIPFSPDTALPVTDDLVENCRLALNMDKALPLGRKSKVKNVPDAAQEVEAKAALLITLHPKVGDPWMMGLHQCSYERVWTAEEKQMYQDISSRITDALSVTLFYRDLEENQERLKHLSSQLFHAHEEERKRVAEEIHDELGQAILAVVMGLENAIFLLGESLPDSVHKSLSSALNLSKGMVRKMRHMQTALYPPTLRDFGAITALNGFIDDFSNIYSKLSVRRGIHIKEVQIPLELRTTIFRVAQEALYNAGKHSKAKNVTVVLDYLGDRLFLEIIDNGVGFDPNTTIRYPASRLGLGLTSMRERAEMTGGVFDIDSKPGHGTVIRTVWRLTKDGSKVLSTR